MATRNIVPRADGEGKLGTTAKKWGEVNAGSVVAGSVSATGAVSAGSVTTTGAVSAESVAATDAVSATGITTRKNSTAYAVDDVAFTASIPGKLVLVCTTAGTTAASEPDMSGAAAGGTVTDGTAVWTYHKLVQEGNPTGTIISYAGDGALPEGYLLCDGSVLSRATYADLFAVIGTTYGVGDGTTTFNLPDFTDGTFAEGAATAGTAKEAGLPNITGIISWRSVNGTESGAFYQTSGYGVGWYGDHQSRIGFNAALSSAIYGKSTTVQPKSLTVRFLIKYE